MDKQIFKYIEHELYQYKDTCKRIDLLREEIMYPYIPSDDNSGVSRSNKINSPTEIQVARVITDKRLQRLEEIKDAIDEVFHKCDPVRRKLIELKYFTKPQLLSWDGVVNKLPISSRTAIRYKKEIIYAIAERIGIL